MTAITAWRDKSIEKVVTLVVAAEGREPSDSDIARLVFAYRIFACAILCSGTWFNYLITGRHLMCWP